MFNSLKYVKVLEEAGVPRKQAEVEMQIMTELIESNLATKQDIADLRQVDLKDIRTEIEKVRTDMQLAMARQTILIGAIVATALSILVALNKLL